MERQRESKPEGRQRPAYQVEYHVLQVIYFDNDHVLTGPEMARVWSGMRAFGDEKVIRTFLATKWICFQFLQAGKVRARFFRASRTHAQRGGAGLRRRHLQ